MIGVDQCFHSGCDGRRKEHEITLISSYYRSLVESVSSNESDMNSAALLSAFFILISSGICFVFGYFSIPGTQRKPFGNEMGWIIGLVFFILLLAGSGYYLIDKQNLPLLMIVIIEVTIGAIAIPLTTQITWSR